MKTKELRRLKSSIDPGPVGRADAREILAKWSAPLICLGEFHQASKHPSSQVVDIHCDLGLLAFYSLKKNPFTHSHPWVLRAQNLDQVVGTAHLVVSKSRHHRHWWICGYLKMYLLIGVLEVQWANLNTVFLHNWKSLETILNRPFLEGHIGQQTWASSSGIPLHPHTTSCTFRADSHWVSSKKFRLPILKLEKHNQ